MNTAGARVLYIDDDAALCRLVEKDLARHGYCVETAGDAASGISRVEKGGIDVVALDHYMPEQDGLATLAAIRRLPEAPPVVYVTAAQEGRIAVAALRAGAANYVAKDTSGEFLDLLRAALEGALSAAETQRAKEAAEREIRAARDRFEALAIERAVLLREVDHRVGNSLQLISSLLHLQAEAARDEEVEAALASASKRVRAVARVHKRLYTSGDVRSVALDTYLESLVADLRESYEADGSSLLLIDAARIEVEPDCAVTIGVIVTELVMNAKKHAYRGRAGESRVGIVRSGTGLLLSVEDDGIGIQRDAAGSGELGTIIIEAMSAKLGGRFWYEKRSRGTRACILFEPQGRLGRSSAKKASEDRACPPEPAEERFGFN